MNEQKPPQNKLSPGAAIFLAGVLAQIGFYLLAWQTESTAEFRGRGGTIEILVVGMAFFLMPVCGVLALVVWGLDKRGLWPRWCPARTILIAGAMLLILGVVIGFTESSPKARYSAHVGVLEDRVSDVQASGINGIIASRWFFAFSVMPDDAAIIASKLGLQEDNPTKLKESLANDHSFFHTPLSDGLQTANPDELKTYSHTQSDDQSRSWIMLTVDARNHRAWLYRGLQN
jgi:hypothetical protein